MDQSVENSTDKKTPGVEKADLQTPKTLSALWEDIIKDRSFMGYVLRFLSHPFVLLGGLIATVYFLTRGRQHRNLSFENELRQQNVALVAELKLLKKKYKKLKHQLGHLTDDGHDYPSGESKKLLTTGKKKIGVARLE